MPAQILHTLFGEDVLIEIHKGMPPRFNAYTEKALEKIQGVYHAVFALGCQGPDIFYHSQMTRPVALEYGALLHRRNFGQFTAALLKGVLEDTRDLNPLTVYALGFMTHAFLDRITHPYIVYKSSIDSVTTDKTKQLNQLFPKGTAHAFFERIIDALMLERLRGIPVCLWDQDALVQICTEPPRGLKTLLVNTLIQIFPKQAQGDEKMLQRIGNALHDCATFYHLTDPQKTSLQCSLPIQKNFLVYLYPEQLPPLVDYLNLKCLPWFYPTETGKEDTRPFPAIYDDAVKTAAEALSVLIAQCLETGVFPLEDAALRLGNGGLSIQDEKGKPCAPTRVGTLPLDEILIQQSLLRGVL